MKYPDPKIVETDWYTTAEVNGNYVRVRIEAFVNRDGETKEYQTKLKKALVSAANTAYFKVWKYKNS